MGRLLSIHPENPQDRLIRQVAAVLNDSGVIIYPTDSSYALGCIPGDKSAIDRIIAIRKLDSKHNMTLLCRDLADIGNFARLENRAFRLIRRLTPGPYTFLLKATKDVPRRLQHPQKKTIGLRIPDHNIILAILACLGAPLLSTSLILPGETLPETDPDEIYEKLGAVVDLVIEGGSGGLEPTTVLDLTGGTPGVIRQGKGDTRDL
jgi:tRNA threonylcarbamoyl adenosine modification protein (Sua5/YciO/YrdC/YwlC family)